MVGTSGLLQCLLLLFFIVKWQHEHTTHPDAGNVTVMSQPVFGAANVITKP